MRSSYVEVESGKRTISIWLSLIALLMLLLIVIAYLADSDSQRHRTANRDISTPVLLSSDGEITVISR